MKTLVAAGLLLATLVSPAAGQDERWAGDQVRVFAALSSYQNADIQRLERNFLGSLNHPLDAVVESAIREITRLKLAQLCCQSDDILEKLRDLSVEGNIPAVRYKATLATMVFENPTMFTEEGAIDYVTGEEMFSAIAHRLEQQLLTVKIE